MGSFPKSTVWTRGGLRTGLVAGPLFVVTVVVQIFTRPGYSFDHQPISFLALGDLGWIQVLNFVLAGVLSIAFAWAIGPRMGGGALSLLLTGFGAGLVVAGFFPPDPAFGFPPGTPEGMPQDITYRSILHGVGFTLAFGSITAACLVLAVRDLRARRWTWAGYSAATAVVGLVLSQWPGMDGASLRYLLAAGVTFAWEFVLAVRASRITS